MTETPDVLLQRRDSAFWITINRPDKRNALNGDVVRGIRQGYRRAQDDPQVRVIVLTGAGEKAFCAGADLQPGASFAFDHSKPNTDYADLLREANACTLPSIARVNGACMAGGMGLLCMTDIALAVQGTQFGLPEVKIGLFPMQVLSLLCSVAPRRKVREWCLSGEPFDAAEALQAGLLNYVVAASDLDERTHWLIERIAGKSPTAIRRGKYALRALDAMSFEEAITYTESQISLLAMTEDAKEGLASFTQRRKPQWTGR